MDGDVKVLATTAMKMVFDALAPSFERSTGQRVAAEFGPSAQIEKRVGGDEAADAAILTSAAARDMLSRGKVLAGSVVDIARSSLGVAVRRGAQRPDLSSAESFKQALLAARSVAVSRPVGAGLSGAHMARVFRELGIEEAMQPKLKYGTGGVSGLVGLILARGEAELGVQQIAELMAVPDIDFVGPLPRQLQCVTPFVGAIPTRADNPEAGRQLIAFLTTAEAKRAIAAKGLEPG